ncbi:MAG: YgdI/YgdR family lipoprotein [Symbiopectobacterium sp.]
MAALSLTACSSNYVLHTNDGSTIIAEGKPKVDEDTGMISMGIVIFGPQRFAACQAKKKHR